MSLSDLLRSRRSCRQFDQSRPLSDDVLEEIMESQRYASCGRNLQTLRYVAVTAPETVELIFRQTHWGGRLSDGSGRPKEGHHPVCFVAVVEHEDVKSNRSDINFGLAVSNMTLTAWNMGIASCIIGNVCRHELYQILDLDEKFKIIALIAFGYPSQSSCIKDICLDDSQAYTLDDQGNLVVPKLMCSETVKYIK